MNGPKGTGMAISRRAFVTSALAAGVLPAREAFALSGELVPIFESDAQDVPVKYRRKVVDFETAEPPGTLVVDTNRRYLFHVQGGGKAVRYGVGVGKDGRTWYGVAEIGRKEKWPIWVPTPEHLAEHPDMVKWIHGMPGGKGNPMGARALYLYQGDVDTVIRIHGAIRSDMIGKKATAGCISLLNIEIIHLYDEVEIGTRAVILPPDA
jgi:lipoprotein-anchoring transpeptidase ErfK/SrfK